MKEQKGNTKRKPTPKHPKSQTKTKRGSNQAKDPLDN